MMQARATILVVDDQESVRALLQRALEQAGYHALTAASGQEALDTMSESSAEVMLLDVRMPGQSGLDVLRHSHTEHPDTAIIMVTVLADVNTVVKAMREGSYDYVTKPFNLDDVLMRVEKARERRHMALIVKNYQESLEERVEQQAAHLRDMTMQTVQSLIQEEILTRELEARGGKREGLPAGTDIKELGAKILRRFRRGASHSPLAG